ncbi:N-acetylmuramic acid/N-acetylglucosamine kinase [Lentibacillus kapialis]|uniref:N-acetylmuramic acid/N-acetylglucosamine kinase n=1 Tax=Lentibacillus kapialis TaxID=340214 RepID=A0A917PQG7_9BACI|nr:BadF/BadG/BcrA/BcrD ATPase family protein [Lentibacillus kapialis]GGJ87154.1 N-acetylmuramic acid/N-acetylglucosamine kinase [Lentibacillus kapialis]
MDYVAGIDGGGTKTVAVMTDLNGKVVAKASMGPVNPNVVNKEELYQTLSDLMQDLKKQNNAAFEQITGLFAGISGAGNNKAVQMLTDILDGLVPDKTSVKVEPDTINALYSGTYGEPGIVQISGTGSITFGIRADGKRDRAGGWGYLFGDEGSGYDIGRSGIIAALKAYDGRGKNTVLLDMVRVHFRTRNLYDLIQQIYASKSPKSAISPAAKLVFNAYKQRDAAARAIIGNTVKELRCSIRTLKAKLYQPEEEIKAVLCGGVFEDEEVLPDLLKREFQDDHQLTIVTPAMPPAGGAIIGALLARNIKPDEYIIRNIKSTY